ncbi:MAG: restriction endonuclease [Planctomycetota bacterium]
MSESLWMVRAGRSAQNIDDFLEDSIVKFEGGAGLGAVSGADKPAIEQALRARHPEAKDGSIGSWASQIVRFAAEPATGDLAITYDNNTRFYYAGPITSDAYEREEDGSLARSVEWRQKVSRDRLLPSTRNTLGSTLTLFQVRDEAAADVGSKLVPIDADEPAPATDEVVADDPGEERLISEEVIGKATEFLEDRIAKLSWEEMEELIAEILRAMGYRARVSPKGADRGVDVIASPDGLGLQEPRIFVEVKHRLGTSISADQVRSFIGGRQTGDRCLYVSTGGFTKDARYEAERSSVPLTLITLSDLRELLVENYDRFSPAGVALIPLERIYWPVPRA